MARLSRKEGRERLAITVLAGVAVGLLLILGIRAIAAFVEGELQESLPVAALPAAPSPASADIFPAPPPLADTTAEVATSTLALAPPPEGSVPSAPPSPPPPQVMPADFTDLFSGTGWSDAARTSAYEDYAAMTISLVPRFAVTPTTAAFSAAPATPADAPADLTGNVRQDGAGYVATVAAYPGLAVTSTYPGILRFGYDPATGRVLVVYAAYMSRVIEMGPPSADGTASVIADYSAEFGPRAFGGGTNGALAVRPVIFAEDGAWWIFSGEGSTEPKLMKVQNGAVIDYTQAAFPREVSLAAAPGPAPHELYVKGNGGSYVFDDEGFAPAPAQWVSSKLNLAGGEVVSGEVAAARTSPASAGAIAYALSDDGGETWIAAVPGRAVDFPVPGNDFRYKILLSPPLSGDRYTTPWVDLITVGYGMKAGS